MKTKIEIYKNLKVRDKELLEKRGKERDCRYFKTKEEAIKLSNKLKKAHKLETTSKESYIKRLRQLVHFIIYEEAISLKDRLKALEALTITEEKYYKTEAVLKELINIKLQQDKLANVYSVYILEDFQTS